MGKNVLWTIDNEQTHMKCMKKFISMPPAHSLVEIFFNTNMTWDHLPNYFITEE